MKPSIDSILSLATDKEVAKTIPKKPRGRPKSSKTLSKEQKEFVENYQSRTEYRPEPKRLIKALSQPEDRLQQALEDAMTIRQRAYCREYVLDFKIREAAIRAGYTTKSAHLTGYNLMQYRSIRKLIDIYTESNATKITSIDPEWVINKVTEIVTMDTAKDSDKLRGLELLARHLGMFIERTEISGRDGEAIKIEETRHQADEVARKLREMGKKAALAAVK